MPELHDAIQPGEPTPERDPREPIVPPPVQEPHDAPTDLPYDGPIRDPFEGPGREPNRRDPDPEEPGWRDPKPVVFNVAPERAPYAKIRGASGAAGTSSPVSTLPEMSM
ncbi:MAG TPA: hypothetical protein VGE98_12625, partial [Thermoanaerobaculia bacterium]